jgi:hypothetical protein
LIFFVLISSSNAIAIITITATTIAPIAAKDNPSCDGFGVGVRVTVGLGEAVTEGVGVAVGVGVGVAVGVGVGVAVGFEVGVGVGVGGS